MNALAPALYRATMPCDLGAACWRSFTYRAPRQLSSVEVLRDLFASLPMEREGWDKETTRIEQIGRRDEDRFWKVSRD